MVKVISVLVKMGNNLLLAKRLKGCFFGQWEFPGGKIEEGESWKDCAKRETLEETGSEVNPIYLLGTQDFPNFNLSVSFVYAEFVNKVGEPSEIEKQKNTPWQWHYCDNLPNPLMHGMPWALEKLRKWESLSKEQQLQDKITQNFDLLVANKDYQIKLLKELFDAQQVFVNTLNARLKQLESYLDHTADGALVCETEKFYCYRCGGKTEAKYDLCYCSSCGNPLPISYSMAFADQLKAKESISAQEKSPAV